MSDQPEKAVNAAPARKTGLSPKEQKLQAMREKLAQGKTGAKPSSAAASQSFSAKNTFAGKKTAFQRKAT